MPTVFLTILGTAQTITSAIPQIVNAITTATAVIIQVSVTVNITLPDFSGFASVQVQLIAALTVSSRSVFANLITSLQTVKTNFPSLTFSLSYQEPATV